MLYLKRFNESQEVLYHRLQENDIIASLKRSQIQQSGNIYFAYIENIDKVKLTNNEINTIKSYVKWNYVYHIEILLAGKQISIISHNNIQRYYICKNDDEYYYVLNIYSDFTMSIYKCDDIDGLLEYLKYESVINQQSEDIRKMVEIKRKK